MKYGFLGCGNMGGAIAKALSQSTKDLLLSDRSGKARVTARSLGCGYGSAAEVAAGCKRVFLAVKPQMMGQLLADLSPILKESRPLLISMAAGLKLEKLEEMLGFRLPMIRIMPNTPVAVGKGTVLYCANDLVDEDSLQGFLRDMTPCGLLDPLPEELFDAGTAAAGCSPAYFYMFVEAIARGAEQTGLPADKALRYAANAMAGAAEMVLTTGQTPGALKDAVCSPGGSTIAGVKVLEQGLSPLTENCIEAAYRRNIELGK